MAALARAPAGRAAFVETRRFAALDGVLESRGWLERGPGRLEKVTSWPEPERLVVDGDRLVVTQGNAAPRVIDLGLAPQLRTFVDAIRAPLSGNAAAVRAAFWPAVTGSSAAWALTLVPREGSAALRSVRIEGHAGVVAAVRVVQGNGDEQEIRIDPVQP